MLRRAALLAVIFVLAAGAHGFCLSYGNVFDVCGLRQEGGVLTLPLARGQYKNIKLLTRQLYTFVQACQTDCRYTLAQGHFEIGEWRRAFTRDNMLIVDVDFDKQISLTFLVFGKPKGAEVRNPEEVVFTDKRLEQSLHQSLQALAVEKL